MTPAIPYARPESARKPLSIRQWRVAGVLFCAAFWAVIAALIWSVVE